MPNHVNYYETLEDCKQKLENTVVTYDGTPAYIHRVTDHADGIHRLNIVMLPGSLAEARRFEEDDEDAVMSGSIRKKINSPKFNRFRPFEMGYCNHYMGEGDSHAKFLSRVPIRRSKQGLTQESLHIGKRASHVPTSFNHVVESEAFRDCVRGEYPGHEEIMDTLAEDSSIGISREFCINRDELGLNFLMYRNEKVGLVRAREVQLADRFSFLREKIIAERKLPSLVVTL